MTRSRIAAEASSSALARNVAILHSGHFNVQIDAIQQRAGNALAITLHLSWTATAFAFEIAKIAAWARIHRGDQHELRRESDAAGSAGDGDFSVFDWLAHYFQCRSFEFRQLIEKQDAVVREADFARVWKCAAAEQTDIADGVMRRAERPRRDERFFAIEQPGDAVNLGRLDRFLQRHRRDDGGDAFGKHRFAGAGRTDHQDVVTASHRDFDGAFDVSLAFYVAKSTS